MREDLQKAWDEAPEAKFVIGTKPAGFSTPGCERIEPELSQNEKVIAVLKGRKINEDLPYSWVLTDEKLHLFSNSLILKKYRSEIVQFGLITGVEVAQVIKSSNVILSRAGNNDGIKNVENESAKNFARLLQEYIGKSGAGGKSQNISDNEFDPILQISKIKGLLDAGAITQEEFDSKKRDLMDRI